jgi:release factor glutamine methyltransferase
MTAAGLVSEAAAALAAAGLPDPERDALLLLGHVLGLDRAVLHSRPERPVDDVATEHFRTLVLRRLAREPVQYLTGVQEFWSLPFRVTPAVLIPRPESEGILEALFALDLPREPRLLDLGTGSGCLAVAAARECPRARVVATDLSEAALEVARGNARRLGVEARIAFRRGDLFDALAPEDEATGFDAIVSNPPYVGAAELETLAPEVRDHEPRAALTPGDDPLAVHRRIAAAAADHLARGGSLLVEIGAGQEEAVRALYAEQPRLRLLRIAADLAGIPRVAVSGLDSAA